MSVIPVEARSHKIVGFEMLGVHRKRLFMIIQYVLLAATGGGRARNRGAGGRNNVDSRRTSPKRK